LSNVETIARLNDAVLKADKSDPNVFPTFLSGPGELESIDESSRSITTLLSASTSAGDATTASTSVTGSSMSVGAATAAPASVTSPMANSSTSVEAATVAPASGFTVGQWNAYGTGHDLSLWRAASPPVAPYKTMANGVNVTAGQTIRDATLAKGGSNALWGYGEGGTYDTDRERWIGTVSSGHAGGGSNEVNEFVASTGNWVRQMDPTVELFSPQNVPWPSSIAYGGVHLEGPLALVDVNNHYPANVSPATGSKLNLYPNASQTYGNVTYMPSPYHKLWVCGGVSNWSPNFANSIIF